MESAIFDDRTSLRRSGGRHSTLALITLGASVLTISGAVAAYTPQTTPVVVAKVCGVTGPVMTEIAKLPANASVADVEGAVLFAIGQLDCAPLDAADALESMLKGGNFNPNQRQAIQNVIASLRAGASRGTGAVRGSGVGGSGGSVFGSSSFSAPSVSVGGGSSNYTSR